MSQTCQWPFFIVLLLFARAHGEVKVSWRHAVMHEMTVITMLSASWRKGEVIPRFTPRYTNTGFVNSWSVQIFKISSVRLHLFELKERWWSQVLKNRLRSLTCVTTLAINDVLEARSRAVLVSSQLYFAFVTSRLNPNTKSSQIGIQCSGTKKCYQMFEINHFCPVNISAIWHS